MWTLGRLKDECRERKLKVGGTKAVLVLQLEENDQVLAGQQSGCVQVPLTRRSSLSLMPSPRSPKESRRGASNPAVPTRPLLAPPPCTPHAPPPLSIQAIDRDQAERDASSLTDAFQHIQRG